MHHSNLYTNFYYCREVHFSTRYQHIYYHDGKRHGYYRKFCVNNKFEEMGIYVHGQLFGEFIMKCEGNSYIIGTHPRLHFDNEGFKDLSAYCTYIYPDLDSCIFGSFKFKKNTMDKDLSEINADLKLECGKYGNINDILWSNGFPLPKCNSSNESFFSYDPSTGMRIR